ncbi:hypothetical protein DFH28DRAFT_1055248 [Melampsora americana]|nr:hypothetical protein DFH28DRAFT_1055248 [Melampsora americana]
MRLTLQWISHIAILLNLELGILALNPKEDIKLLPDQVKTKWKADTFVLTGSKMWTALELSAVSSQHQFTYSDERIADEGKRTAHPFHESWQGGPHQPSRLTRKLGKRSPALESVFHGASDIGEIVQGSKAEETISDINKAREISGSSKALSGTDPTKIGKADSFRGTTSRLDPVPALSRSKSLPKSLTGVDRLDTLEAMDMRFEKSLFQLTDDVIKREPEAPYVEYDQMEHMYQQKIQRPLTFEAFLALYAEKELFQTIIDGKSDMKTINALADILEKQRGRYVEALKKGIKEGVEGKTFLNYGSVLDEHTEVISLRKSIWAYEVHGDQISKAKNLPKGVKGVSFPESLAEDETRGKDTDVLWQKSLVEITADEYFSYMYKPKSSIDIVPAEDASIQTVKRWAIEAVEDERILDTTLTPQTYKQARASRRLFQWHLQSYVQKEGTDFVLFTDLQEIFNQKGIPLGIKTPSKSKVLIWYDKFASKFQKAMRKIKSLLKKFLVKKKQPRPPNTVDPREII